MEQQLFKPLTKQEQLQALSKVMEVLGEVEVKVKFTPIIMNSMAALEQVVNSLRVELATKEK